MTPEISRLSPSGMIGRAVVALLIAVCVTACTSKSDTQLASDSLQNGLAAQASGMLDQAATDYSDCVKHDSGNKFCLYDLGTVEQAQGDTVGAEANYRLALVTDPNYAPAIFNLAILRAQAGASAEAIGLYREYVKLMPKDAAGHLNIGLLLIQTGDTTEGNAQVAQALALDPSLKSRLASPSRASTSPAPSPKSSAKASPKPSA